MYIQAQLIQLLKSENLQTSTNLFFDDISHGEIEGESND